MIFVLGRMYDACKYVPNDASEPEWELDPELVLPDTAEFEPQTKAILFAWRHSNDKKGAKKTAEFRRMFFAQLNLDECLAHLLASDLTWETCWQDLDREDIHRCRRLASCWYRVGYAERAFNFPWTVMPILLSIKRGRKPGFSVLANTIPLLMR